MTDTRHPPMTTRELERIKKERRIRKLRSSPADMETLRKVRARIVSGMDLDRIRDELQLWAGFKWDDMMTCLQRDPTSEVLYKQWSLRANDRYALANQAVIETKDISNVAARLKVKLAAIMTMQKADEHAVYLYERLGIVDVKPLPGESAAEASGFTSDDLQAAEEQIRKELENDVRDQLRLETIASAPVDIALLEAPQPRGPQDPLGQAPMDADDNGGSK